jgi:hypothetical protein
MEILVTRLSETAWSRWQGIFQATADSSSTAAQYMIILRQGASRTVRSAPDQSDVNTRPVGGILNASGFLRQ